MRGNLHTLRICSNIYLKFYYTRVISHWHILYTWLQNTCANCYQLALSYHFFNTIQYKNSWYDSRLPMNIILNFSIGFSCWCIITLCCTQCLYLVSVNSHSTTGRPLYSQNNGNWFGFLWINKNWIIGKSSDFHN